MREAAVAALTEAGVPHVAQNDRNMFSVFFSDDDGAGPVTDFAGASRQRLDRYAAFFHSMLDQGVHLPPSAFEIWFLSAAHDDAAAGPHRLRAARRRPRRRRGARPHLRRDRMKTVVHLVRHGEVHNPVGILYGRRPGYHLSDLGQQMATRVAEVICERDITGVYASPLERAQETAQPLADALALDLRTDERVIESSNVFEGQTFGAGQGVLKHPRAWQHLWNPLRPSWGEPYKQVVARMTRGRPRRPRRPPRARGRVVVSHQLPIWITRLHLEGKPFLHDPRKRQCTLCSLTSLTFEDDRLTTADLLRAGRRPHPGPRPQQDLLQRRQRRWRPEAPGGRA